MSTFRARPEQLPFLSRSRTSLAVRLNKQHALLATTVQRPCKLSWCRRWRAVEGKCWSVCGRCRSAKVGALLASPCRAAAGPVAFKPYFAFPPSVTPNPSFKRTASPPLNSNVGRHKELVCESPASCHCAEAVKASGSVPVCLGCAARKGNAYASVQAGATPLCRGRQRPWRFAQTSNTRFSEPPRKGLSSSVGAGAGAPPKANVGQSGGAAAQRRSAQPFQHRVERQRARWRSNRTSLVHQSDAQPFHQADSQRAAPFACRLCQTLGLTTATLRLTVRGTCDD